MQIKGLLPALLTAALLFPAHAVQLRVATYNVRLGLEAPGTAGHDAAKAVLARINADVVALQEVTIGDASSGSPSNLSSLANALGFPHLFVSSSALDTQNRVVLMSKFPFVENSTDDIISPEGANDVTRSAAVARINVPGTVNDPLIVTAHLKCCFEEDDPFRRAVEMMRIQKYLEAQGLNEDDNVFVVGDFNLLGGNLTFSSLPQGLPATFSLGNDITFDVPYYSNPTDYFTAEGLVNPGYLQQNGSSTNTFITGGILDHILVSGALAARNPMTEIYNSEHDSIFPGLPKSGGPLPSETSEDASDHYAVFGDFELDGGLPLSVSITPSSLTESSAPATVTVTLPNPAAETVRITLTSTDNTEAILASNTLTFAPGQSEQTTTLTPRVDSILDGSQALEIQAAGSGYNGTSANVTVDDSDAPFYSLTQLGSPVVDTFPNFAGEQSPSEWLVAGATWSGLDDGSSTTRAARSYGEGSIGILTSSETSFTTSIRNDTGSPISSLRVDYLATQWLSRQNGSPDRWQVSFTENGTTKSLQDLEFVASTQLPSGAINPPSAHPRKAYLRGLNLQPADSITLTFTAKPGEGGTTASADVFVNELHYDNQGTDAGEFIEVVVGPAFTGDLSEIVLYLYNGSNGSPYDSPHPLSTFQQGTVAPSGHRFFWKEITGIQNGAPDGFALVANEIVQEFLSYEGTFTASGGPADGMTSVSIGVSQNNSSEVGQSSLALAGTGSFSNDLTWGTQAGEFTAGEINAGQSFGAAVQPQGIGLDNFSIVALIDSDGDQLSDDEEWALGTNPDKSDSDGDGQDDFFESVLAETDPLSSSSLLEITLVADSSGITTVSFPTLEGRIYIIEYSADLETWLQSEGFEGDGGPRGLVFPETDKIFFRVRIIAP